MKIALMTEGTYPFAFGGVSVWCDQLIRGMPGYDFHLVALVATAAEPAVWALPGNVVSMVKVPLWGPAPVPANGRRPGGRRAGLPLRLLRQLVDILLDSPADAQHRFGCVLRELHVCVIQLKEPWRAGVVRRAGGRRGALELPAPLVVGDEDIVDVLAEIVALVAEMGVLGHPVDQPGSQQQPLGLAGVVVEVER